MELKDIESDLKFLRITGCKPIEIDLKSLSSSNRLKVENGENYHIDHLFQYLNEYGQVLTVNGCSIPDRNKLGIFLKEYRLKNKITKLDVEINSGTYTLQLDNIEKGKGYRRNTLTKYLTCLPNIDFDYHKK